MYEAGMNISWLKTAPNDKTARQIMGDIPTLADVRAVADSCYNYSDDQTLASSQDKARKVFPAVLAAYVDSAKVLERQAFQESLQQLDGHIFAMGVVALPP